jgi:hypothetical protein
MLERIIMSENTQEKRVRNPLNEALPQVFNREGLVKKNPDGNRATGKDFHRVMAKTLFIRNAVTSPDAPARIRIQISAGSLTLTRDMSMLLIPMGHEDDEQPDIIAALLLNGWNITTTMGGS